ncbi:DUF1800 domain-containing protein [Tumebacillus permanentifrigoris]|uniref:Uncharacterized protein DUF1800 n=1 Tax=Tumebacillus permanentifrigoris TaxID=378543 RepID=A0A316D6V6_9BACL|nr:DUF1800 domain-containing protein [Tumebacillus permanentifrigoris]PWK11342.1 uncharacterized protein DUF1800 [Tumebacillus permanentifrigoris]
MSTAKIAHLLRRTGFTATKAQVDALSSLSIPQVVDKLLNAALTAPKPPDGLDEKTDIKKLVQWWIDIMVRTSNPLQEKMTLFWHGHFTSNYRKVRNIDLIAQQNVLLRKHALGNFRDLAYNISIDPAMLIYLDNNTNLKKSPNENYARELMELFTLGIGTYTETDVREVARALTGWTTSKGDRKAIFQKNQHDESNKTIFKKTDNFDLKKTIDWIVEQPTCATFITTKLWQAFASPTPDPAVIKSLAKTFVDSGYEIKALLRAMFTSDAFYASTTYRSLVLSPVEYIVGMYSLFPNAKYADDKQALNLLTQMGQQPFDPPSVAGWPGGAAWLSASALFIRYNFVDWFTLQLTESDFALNPTSSIPALLNDALNKYGLMDLSPHTRVVIESYLNKSNLASKETIYRGLLHLLLVSPEAQVH